MTIVRIHFSAWMKPIAFQQIRGTGVPSALSGVKGAIRRNVDPGITSAPDATTRNPAMIIKAPAHEG